MLTYRQKGTEKEFRNTQSPKIIISQLFTANDVLGLLPWNIYTQTVTYISSATTSRKSVSIPTRLV